MRDFVTKINDTAPLSTGILDAAEDNVRFQELETAVTASGITLDASGGPDTSTQMLAESLTRHVGAAMACSDSGSANAYVLTLIGNFVPPTALVSELRVRCKPGNANTGASTLNFAGLGVKPIVDHTYAPLTSGALDGRDAEFIYRSSVGASGSWVLPAWSNALYVGQVPSSPPSITSGEGWAVDGSNFGNLNFSGLTNLATLDPTDVFARYVSAGGVNHHRGVTYAQLADALAGGGRLLGLQWLTISGTYTKAVGTTKAFVIATGGGGGGGSENVSGAGTGGGGGAGATAIDLIDLSVVSTVTFLIGAGGAGGVNSDGSAGGSTSFGAHLVAGGGSGGGRGNNVSGGGSNGFGGAGGSATTGTIKLGGGAGGSAANIDGGLGGSSFWGGGGQPGNAYVNGVPPANGGAGSAPGAGGGGGDYAGNGGAGAAGAIMVLEFA